MIQLNLFDDDRDKSKKRFFDRKRSWSASKHRIVLRYIQSFCYTQAGHTGFVNYVDGFAGSGKYDEGIGIEDFVKSSNFWKRYEIDLNNTDGSPLIALKLSKCFSLEGRLNLRCFFVEKDRRTNQILQENCQAIDLDSLCKIYPPRDFEQLLDSIIQDLQEHPTIFFLDTFGVKGVSFETIGQIAKYATSNRGELFLLFHNRSVARAAGQSTPSTEDERMLKAAKTYSKGLTDLLGRNSEDIWQSKWLELKNESQEFEKWALNFFKRQISLQTSFRGVSSYAIKETYQDIRPQYHIVVCSNFPQKAFGEFLNESFCDEDKLLFYQVDPSGENKQFLDKEWKREEQRRLDEVKPCIISYLKRYDDCWIELKELTTEIILEIAKVHSLGILKRSVYRDLLIEFYREGLLEAQELGSKGKPTWKSRVKVNPDVDLE